jgi:hypothetical protein
LGSFAARDVMDSSRQAPWHLDLSEVGRLNGDLLLGARAFLLPAFALGAALYVSARGSRLAWIVLGAALGPFHAAQRAGADRGTEPGPRSGDASGVRPDWLASVGCSRACWRARLRASDASQARWSAPLSAPSRAWRASRRQSAHALGADPGRAGLSSSIARRPDDDRADDRLRARRGRSTAPADARGERRGGRRQRLRLCVEPRRPRGLDWPGAARAPRRTAHAAARPHRCSSWARRTSIARRWHAQMEELETRLFEGAEQALRGASSRRAS